MFVEMLSEKTDKIAVFNDLPFEEQVQIINQFYKNTKNKNKIYKKGAFYYITDFESCENFGLAHYDEDGNYIEEYEKSEVKQFIYDFVANLDRKNLRDFCSIIEEPQS